jgi:polyhydroxyalkanoate synthesis regulator phasin
MARSSGPRGSGSSKGSESTQKRSQSKWAERTPAATGKVATARDRLVRGMLSPLNVVLLTRRHIEEVLDDAVMRGRMTRTDAQETIQSLLSRGARATDDLLSDIERLLGTRGDSLESEPIEGDNGAGTTSNLPIANYDELSAAQVQERLDALTPAELRKLRDYEQRHANRKTVLDRIQRRLR